MDDKTRKKVETMRRAGKMLGEVLKEVLLAVNPGVTEIELDRLAERLILEKGGEVSFKKVDGYQHAICVSTNDVVVHGIPKDRVLNKGDIIGIDCGVYLEGFHTDMAETIVVGGTDDESVKNLLKVGKKAMYEGIKQAKIGHRVGHISRAMQETMESGGYSVVRSLVGHGVGKELHEAPEIPGYLEKEIRRTPLLTEGMTIAIEAIYNMGGSGVKYDGSDDWTIVSEDRSLAGLFERTIVLTSEGPELITYFPDEMLPLA
ncbi:MAG: type I methionyl aminopeptidase [Candidatus Levybacteria bacterium]|nr:type I methionyl aminopeptidase [Candidatus Levybacteria bacterium]